jgi:long-chain fatty acid transport protein
MGLLSLCLNAHADEFHYNNILIGDRASGMGGAYTAVSDDPSGMFYNPAGIAYAKGKSMSASVNAYHAVSKKYDGVIGGNGWKRNSSSLLPNYFGVLQPIGKLKVGFSYAVPDSSQEDQDQTFYNLASTIPGVTVDSYVINFNNSDSINNFGPSVAAELTDNLSVGLTLYAHKRNSHLIFNQLVELSNGASEWTNQYLETDEWAVRTVVALMWAPMDKLSVGLSLAKTFVLTSDTKLQLTGH